MNTRNTLRAVTMVGLLTTLALVAVAPTASADPASYCNSSPKASLECNVFRPVINTLTGTGGLCTNKMLDPGSPALAGLCETTMDSRDVVIGFIWKSCQLNTPIDV